MPGTRKQQGAADPVLAVAEHEAASPSKLANAMKPISKRALPNHAPNAGAIASTSGNAAQWIAHSIEPVAPRRSSRPLRAMGRRAGSKEADMTFGMVVSGAGTV